MKPLKENIEEEVFEATQSKTVREISKILGVSKNKLLEEAKTKSFIDDILEANPKNKKLAIYIISEVDASYFTRLKPTMRNDPEIIKVILEQSLDYLNQIPKDKISNNLSYGKIIISTMLRIGKNIFDILKLLEKYYKTAKDNSIYPKLFEFLSKTLKKSEDIYVDDLSKSMLNLKSKNEELFKLLSTKAVEGKEKKLYVRANLVKEFYKQLSGNRDYEEAEDKIKRQIEFDTMISILHINLSYLNPDSVYLIDTIVRLCISNDNFKKLEVKKATDSSYGGENDDDEDELDEDIDTEDKLDFFLPSSSYNVTDNGDVTIDSTSKVVIKLSKEEADRFSSLGLKNFITFYHMLYDLGLNFLWDNHKTKLSILLNNKVDFDYPSAAGVTEARALRVFNFLLRNTGTLKEGDRDYQTLDGANLALKALNKSRIIDGETYPPELTSGSPVEMYFKAKGLIKNGELITSAFSKIGESPDEKDEIPELGFLETILPLSEAIKKQDDNSESVNRLSA